MDNFFSEKADASAFIAIDVPLNNYEMHVTRIVRQLQLRGLRCKALTGEGIIEMADDIRAAAAQGDPAA